MSEAQRLPARVTGLLESGVMCEFATISSVSVPIDTPMLYFPSAGLASLDVGTGLAYPVKAERARNNPRTGITVQGTADEPVVAVAGLAAVEDADLQATTDRYITETAFALVGGVSWELARQAVWYWTRMIVKVKPVRIYWWDNPAAMDQPPQVWNAPAGTVYPKSDPRPPGELSKGPQSWKKPSWQDLARQALDRKAPAHLTLCDAHGFPIPLPVRPISCDGERFLIEVPKGVPWQREGTATLTFQGLETFVGEVTAQGATTVLRVERAMPVHPQMEDPVTQWKPTPENRAILMNRLLHETARRGQAIPTIPQEPPEPTPGAKLRMARIRQAAATEFAAGSDGSPLSNLAELVPTSTREEDSRR